MISSTFLWKFFISSPVIKPKSVKENYKAVLSSVVLFIVLFKVVLTFKFGDEIMKCHHSNESYKAVLSCGTVY